jgi:hypothetical protein
LWVSAWTVAEYDNFGAISYWLSHGMISVDVYNGILNNCNLSAIGPLAVDEKSELFRTMPDVEAEENLGDDYAVCSNFQNEAQNMLGNIWIYDIYADVCLDNTKVCCVSVVYGVFGVKSWGFGRVNQVVVWQAPTTRLAA